MAAAATSAMGDCPKPKSMVRAKHWDDEVENAFSTDLSLDNQIVQERIRFQEAGYRDELEYRIVNQAHPEKWPTTGYVKKLQRKDGTFYYYNQARECQDKEVHKIKLYKY